MPLFKKKESERKSNFDIPDLPSFPEVREIKEALKPETHSDVIPPLPQLPNLSSPYPVQAQPLQKPDSKMAREMGPAVWPEKEDKGPMTREVGDDFHVQEKPTPPVYSPKPSPALSRPAPEVSRSMPEPRSKEPIFIKIDRFGEALKNFELIKNKVEELDSLLKKTREIKQREQEEFDSWEKEIEDIKEKISAIDEKLFSKLD